MLEQIHCIYINFNGKNCFGWQTICFVNQVQEQIKFVNQGSTALNFVQKIDISIIYLKHPITIIYPSCKICPRVGK